MFYCASNGLYVFTGLYKMILSCMKFYRYLSISKFFSIDFRKFVKIVKYVKESHPILKVLVQVEMKRRC